MRKHKHDYKPIPVGSQKDWYEYDASGNLVLDMKKQPVISDEKWLAARKNANGWQPDGFCIGGSSASIVAGIYPGHENGCLSDTFGCKFRLFNEMTGVKPVHEQEKPNELLHVGHVFEDAIATVATEELNENFFSKKGQFAYLLNDERMFLCGIEDENGNLKYPHAIADMDRILEVHDKKTDTVIAYYGLEIKSAHIGALKEDHWICSEHNPLGVPEKYEVQCRHYMGVCNIDGFFIACQEHSMLPKDLCIRYIPRDIDLEERILLNEETFIQNHCITGTAPDAEEDDPIKYMEALGEYSEEYQKNETAFEFPLEAEEIINNILFATEQEKQIKQEYDKKLKNLAAFKAESEATLSAFFNEECKEYGTMVLSNGKRCFVRQNIGHARDTFDIARLEKENPTLASLCIKKSVVQTGLKKADRCDLQAFAIPGAANGKITTKINVVENKK